MLQLCTSHAKGQKSVRVIRVFHWSSLAGSSYSLSVSFQCGSLALLQPQLKETVQNRWNSTFILRAYAHVWRKQYTHIYLPPYNPQHSLSEIHWLNKHSRLNYLFVFMIYFILTLQLNGFPICPTCSTTVPCPWAAHFTCQRTDNEVSHKFPLSYE